MFGLGLWEILIILFVAVILVNPKDLPKFFRSLGKLYGQWRSFSVSLNRTIKTTIQQEAESTIHPLNSPVKEPPEAKLLTGTPEDQAEASAKPVKGKKAKASAGRHKRKTVPAAPSPRKQVNRAPKSIKSTKRNTLPRQAKNYNS